MTVEPSEPYELFIAYPGGDKEIAVTLYELVNGRVRAFVDCMCLHPEEPFDRIIPARQEECLATVILVSDRWQEQHYASDEVVTALRLHRNQGHGVVPIWMDDDAHRIGAYGLNSRDGLHFSEIKSWSLVADQLVGLVERERSKLRHRNLATQAAELLTPRDKDALHKLEILELFSSRVSLISSVKEKTQQSILDQWSTGRLENRSGDPGLSRS